MVGRQLSGMPRHVSFAIQMASVSAQFPCSLDSRRSGHSLLAPKSAGSSFASCFKPHRASRHFALSLGGVRKGYKGRQGFQRQSRLTFRSRRTASPPLNSSVEAQPNIQMIETIAESDLASSTHRLTTFSLARLFLGLLAIVIVALLQVFSTGFSASSFSFVAFGALASLVCSFGYACVGIARSNGREKRLWMLFAICSGWFPYLFLMYVAFYQGMWSLIREFSTFSWATLFIGLGFTFFGLFTLKHLQTITDVVRAVRESMES